MLQLSDVNWPVFSLVLALLLIFGALYALLMRIMAQRGIEDQTALMVVFGVLVTVLVSSVLIGPIAAVLELACFAASGLPMVVEYIVRVQSARRADSQAARAAAQDLLK